MFAVFVMLWSINFVLMAANRVSDACQILDASIDATKIDGLISQVIVVRSLGGIQATMTLCQRQGTAWHSVFRPSFRAVIGKHGMASIGKKKEGDLKTPAGLYPIGDAFGSQPLALHLNYKYITRDDKFIDDVTSKQYNTWVTGSTNAKSYESMLIKPYALGAVVNYNMNPIVAGAGSAIFIHIWRASNRPTAGCIAMDKSDILKMLHWLDKQQHPYILVV